MPTIVSKSDFNTELTIPNVQDVPNIYGTDNPNYNDKLQQYIDKFEKLLLVNALGVEQYDLLIADVATSGKWFDLKVILKPIIVQYVYVNFLKYEHSQYSTTGMQRPNAQNSTNVIQTERLVEYWNTFVNMYQGNTWGCEWSSEGSLYAFLADKPDDYSVDWFRFYQIQNVLGI